MNAFGQSVLISAIKHLDKSTGTESSAKQAVELLLNLLPEKIQDLLIAERGWYWATITTQESSETLSRYRVKI